MNIVASFSGTQTVVPEKWRVPEELIFRNFGTNCLGVPQLKKTLMRIIFLSLNNVKLA